MAIPKKASDLVAYGSNFSAVLSNDPATYLQDAAKATAVATAYSTFAISQSALVAARENGVFSKQATAERNLVMANFLALIRPIYNTVQGATSISVAEKIALGVEVRNPPSPIPAPTIEPTVDVENRYGRSFVVRVHDGSTARRKPEGVAQILIFVCQGATPAADPADWSCVAVTGKTTTTFTLSPSLPAGTQVWISASYRNAAGTGPGSSPIGTTVAGGSQALPIAA
jgi:hypothetical protein